MEAQRKADVTRTTAYDNASKMAAEAQDEANKKAVLATDAFWRARQDLASDTEGKLEKMDQRVTDLRARISAAPTLKEPRPELERKVDNVVAQLNRVRANLATATKSEDMASFDGAKARLQDDVRAIDAALLKLTKEV